MIEKLMIGPLCGLCQAEAVHIVLSNLSAKAPRVGECLACAIHPLGEGSPSATDLKVVIPSCGDGSSVCDNDCT